MKRREPHTWLSKMAINLESIFHEDFYGLKWQVNANEIRTITWSSVNDSLQYSWGEQISVTASLDNYLGEIRKAFQIWDDAIERIKFVETKSGNLADIAIAATDIDGEDGIEGQWWYDYDDNDHITEGTIQFDRYDLNNGWLLTTAMHEIGNILGLGDLIASNQYMSVQEDQGDQKALDNFTGHYLWDFDRKLINSLYPSTEQYKNPSLGRLYTAAFGRKPDDAGLQFWANEVNDPLVSYKDVAQNFVDSAEFSVIAPPESSSDFFTTVLYWNVLGREPDSSGLGYWTSQLDSGLQDRADVLIGFANSPENIALYESLA